MKHFLLTIIVLCSFQACNTYKKAQRDIYSGNFDQALDNMIKKYAKGNIKEKDMLKWFSTFNEAYTKANTQNIDDIYRSQYLNEGSDRYRRIYHNYIALQSRYDKLKPFLPIVVNGEVLPIKNENYYIALEQAKLKLSSAIYSEAEQLMKSGYKMDARLAYDKYIEVSQLNPNCASIQTKIEESYQRGLTNILVTINNDSRSILPQNLLNDLTYFQADNSQFVWQKFHSQPSDMIFDYRLELNFREIAVSPELIDRNHSIYKKEWIDSSEYVLDRKGQRIKDSIGRPIRNYTRKTSKCNVMQINQSKSAFIQSEFLVMDRNGQLISRISPIESNFKFKHISYSIEGDEQALDNEFLRKINHQTFIPFPSDEQMVYDCGQDLKNRFSDFITSNVAGK